MVKLILDTDIGCDCDDAGAMAVMHALAAKGECEILAVTHCTSRSCGAGCIDAINTFYGREDIPVGTLMKSGFLDNQNYRKYSSAIAERFPNKYKLNADCMEATALLRKTLASQEDKSVVIAAIGPMINIRLFLESEPDEYSVFSGYELAERKVKELCIMGGSFPSENGHIYFGDNSVITEWNIVQDVESAQIIVDRWPTPIVFSPYEVGYPIKTGGKLLEKGKEDNPVRLAYEIFCNCARHSWDPCTVYYAIRGTDNLFELSPYGTVSFDKIGVSSFKIDPRGRHRYLINKSNAEKAAHTLDNLMCYEIKKKVII